MGPAPQRPCTAFGISTPKRVAALLAQVGHESASLTRTVENLNYGAQGMADTWPSRYAVDPTAKPAKYDQRYTGTYNARRDSLEKFWAPAFGHNHGLLVVDTFYENVEGPEGKNQVVQFTLRTGEPMLVACLWSHWTDPAGKEPDLLSFAAITDDPEPEVAAAGHDRTIINIKPEHVDAWLNPDLADLAALYGIFDDKRHPLYEHKLAA